MKNPLSQKQTEFLKSKHKRINLLSGSVRSGKTHVSLISWALFVGSMPSNYEFIMVGKTVTALKRNCLNLLIDLVGSNNFKYSITQKSATLFGRRVWLEGANDERSESKIRGMTLAGAYCDELTLFPQGFYMMLISRLSLPGSQLFATTNPDSPNHWVKKDIIDNEEIQPQFSNWHFTLDDNDFNDPQYVEDLKSTYTGVFYDRLIRGTWTLAEGLIYRPFADNPSRYFLQHTMPNGEVNPEFPRLMEINVGLDFGDNGSRHSLVATGITPGYNQLIALRSELKDAPGTVSKDIEKFTIDFIGKIIEKYGRCDYLYYDNASGVLGRGVYEALNNAYPQVSVRPCYKGTIKDRIDLLCRLLGIERFKYTEDCQTLKEAIEQAVWNSKKDDERLDDGTTDCDSLDSFEYSWSNQMKRFIF